MEQADRSFAQLRRGIVEYCLLALLVREERYGFDLVRSLSQSGLVAGEGTVYPLLTRLARDAYVTTTWRESPSGPPRKYYAITARGKQALAQFQPEWARFRGAVDRLFEQGEEEP
jgi:PadR family transcriptional regulator PadR